MISGGCPASTRTYRGRSAAAWGQPYASDSSTVSQLPLDLAHERDDTEVSFRDVVPLRALRLPTCHVHGATDEPRRRHHQDRGGFGQSAEDVQRSRRSDHGHAEAAHLVSIAPGAGRTSDTIIVVHAGVSTGRRLCHHYRASRRWRGGPNILQSR